MSAALAAGASVVGASTVPQRPPWRRVLYERQPYDDDYVDESFLSYLPEYREEVYTRRRSHANTSNNNSGGVGGVGGGGGGGSGVYGGDFWAIARDTCPITQQVSVIVLFVTVWGLVLTDRMSVWQLVAVDVVAPALAFGVDGGARNMEYVRQHAFVTATKAFIFVSTLLGLSPVLKTLTLSYADDSIWALSILLSVAHVVTFDYGALHSAGDDGDGDGDGDNTRHMFHGAVSLNAAIFASVLLASRMPHSQQVFALMTFAFELFAGMPVLAHSVRRRSRDQHEYLVLFIVAVTIALLLIAKPLLAGAYSVAVLLITFVGPRMLLWVQRFKENIHGPWDYKDDEEGLG